MTAPTGTFLAPVRNGAIQFPPPLKAWCEHAGWNLFDITVDTPDRLRLEPVMPGGTGDLEGYQSSLDPQGSLWVPAELRAFVALQEQSVMVRIEDGAIRIFLRKVFDTLGFRP